MIFINLYIGKYLTKPIKCHITVKKSMYVYFLQKKYDLLSKRIDDNILRLTHLHIFLNIHDNSIDCIRKHTYDIR